MSIEKRQFERSDIFLVVEFRPFKKTLEYSLGITRNFSHAGFSLESQYIDLKPGEILEFNLKHPQSDLTVSALGEIVWKREGWYKCITGIKLSAMDQGAKSKILELISADSDVPIESSLYGKDSKTAIRHKEEEKSATEFNTEQKEDLILKASYKDNKDTSFIAPKYNEVSSKEDTPVTGSKSESSADETVSETETSERVDVTQERQEKSRSYIPVVAVIVLILSVALFLTFENSKKATKSLIPSSTNSSSLQHTNNNQPLIAANNAQISSLSIKELPELDQTKTKLVKSNKLPEIEKNVNLEETITKRPIEKDIAEKQSVLAIINDQTNDLIMQELPESDQPQTTPEINRELPEQKKAANLKELSLKTDKAEMSAERSDLEPVAITIDKKEPAPSKKTSDTYELDIDREISEIRSPDTNVSSPGSDSDIPERTEKEIKPEIASKMEYALEIKNQSTPDASPVLQDNTSNHEVQLSKTQEVIPTFKKEQLVIYEELFNNNANNWDIFDTIMASARIEGGKYNIENKRKTGAHIILHYHDFPHDQDFMIEASIKTVRSSENHSYGFVLGAKDARNNYVFQIRADEVYSIMKYHKGATQKLAGGRITNIVINQNSANTLKIEKQGNNIHFYVNDDYLDKVSNIFFYGNKVGFIIEGKSEITVDEIHLQVWF